MFQCIYIHSLLPFHSLYMMCSCGIASELAPVITLLIDSHGMLSMYNISYDVSYEMLIDMMYTVHVCVYIYNDTMLYR